MPPVRLSPWVVLTALVLVLAANVGAVPFYLLLTLLTVRWAVRKARGPT